ncbi:MAG: chorismate synthase [Candidatus Brockarchaeota archaeon]|nr:chorismate synthase [Candidatus Brockarchaeota archaeon]
MPGNSIGRMFVVTSFGESHGACVGSLVDGCPAGLELNAGEVQAFLDKRQRNVLGSPRREPDKLEILSGVFEGFTTGAPICLVIWNRDVDSSAYEEIRHVPRPGHADYAARARYGGFNDYRGGGRFSGRITAGFVAAGGVAKAVLGRIGVEVAAHSLSIGRVSVGGEFTIEKVKRAYESPVRCADPEVSAKMVEEIAKAEAEGDSLGGVVEAIATGLPPGVGDPVFESLDSELAKALVSIPAVKAVGFGEGFGASALRGSENNDQFLSVDGKVSARTNRAGGVLGGLSSGMPLVVRVAFKPTPSIKREQRSVDLMSGKEVKIKLQGRFDPCVVPRAVPVVEAMCSIVLADQCIRCGLIPQVLR